MAKFATGQTGNPGGRPKGAVEARDLARKPTVALLRTGPLRERNAEGRVPEGVEPDLFHRVPLTIDRTGAGSVQRGLMPERNGIFGYNLSSSE
jgi:hypothetical protein